MQYKGILTWLSTHRQITTRSHKITVKTEYTSACILIYLSVASQGEMVDHHVRSRKTDAHTQTNRLDPAEDICGRQSCPIHCSCSSDGIHCGLVIHWPYPSWHSLKARSVVNVYATWQSDMKFGTMYKKLSHNPLSSIAPMVRLATLQSTVHKCTQHFFRHCTVCLFSMPAKKTKNKTM
jgi:hypothetical protein